MIFRCGVGGAPQASQDFQAAHGSGMLMSSSTRSIGLARWHPKLWPAADLGALDAVGLQHGLAELADARFVIDDQHAMDARTCRPGLRRSIALVDARRHGQGSANSPARHRDLRNGSIARMTACGVWIAILGSSGHHALDNVFQLGGRSAAGHPHRSGGGWSCVQHAARVDVVFGWERQPARQAPEQRAAQAVDVGANIHRAGVAGLLRGHVVDGAQQGAGLCQAGVEASGQAEIEQLGLFFRRHQDVGRLDVAMDQVELVDLGQGTGDLVHEVAGLGPASAVHGLTTPPGRGPARIP